MTRSLIIALALAALALNGCGDKGGAESKNAGKATGAKTAEPSPVKVPAVEAPPGAAEQPEERRESVTPAPATAPEAKPAAIDNPVVTAPPAVIEAPVADAPPVEEPPTADVPAGELLPMDLSAIDSTVKVIVMAPAGAVARDDYGSIEITKEPDFQMEFSAEDAVDFLERKKEIEANGINRLKKYHVDTGDTLIYETEIMGKPEFHFLATVKVDAVLYLCEDQKGPVFSREAVAAMLSTCRSAQHKAHVLPMPALDGRPGPVMPKLDLD